ncbi:MAG: hypothetical protein HUN04_12145 [Desulfobacter sp.]|nr:MAG: hypothetical protein HUN04_12145 [Desulfobacter sp.]
MKYLNRIHHFVLGGLLVFLAFSPQNVRGESLSRVMILHSYHESSPWDISVEKGVRAALADENYIADDTLMISSFYMDTKRRSSKEWKIDAGKMARDAIEKMNPHVVIALDDNCQEYVVRRMLETDYTFVFAGVNREPEEYGIIADRDRPGGRITGVLDRERFSESLALLRRMVPGVKRLAVISDGSITGQPVVERIKAQAPAEGAEIVASLRTDSFSEWKEFVTAVQDKADALIVVVYHTIKDRDGDHVPAENVLAWTSRNSSLPDMGFWTDTVSDGLLCSDAIDGYEQGYQAGTIAAYVLGGQSAGDFPVDAPRTGLPCINTARAASLGIEVPAHLTKTAKVFRKMTAQH